jgi:hypothetical protein
MDKRIKERAQLIRPLLVPLILYIGFLALFTTLVGSQTSTTWKLVLALLPLLPGIFLAFGIIQAIRKLDELERKIQQEAIAFSFACTFILLNALGLLKIAGLPTPNPVFISLFMAVMWFAAKLWIKRRY